MKSIAVLFLTAILFATGGQAEDLFETCPCGPDSIKGALRKLLKKGQGFKGADFRDSCRAHDACYDTRGADRKSCDLAFLENLLADCKNSRRPKGCHRKARFTFWLVDRFGARPFRSAQEVIGQGGK